MQFLILSVTPETKTHISLRLNWTNFLLSTRHLPSTSYCSQMSACCSAACCYGLNLPFQFSGQNKNNRMTEKTICPVVRVVSILCTVRGARLSDAHIHQFRQARQRAPAGLTHVTLTISSGRWRALVIFSWLLILSALVSPS